ncbi:MAG: hypothetical protein ACTSYO_08335 [Candidatus Ranarchaeia archaeon]
MSKPPSDVSEHCFEDLESLQKELTVGKGFSIAEYRAKKQEPLCGFGLVGLSCRICHQGPCRIDPFGNGNLEGVCGATADLIAARHWLQYVIYGGLETYNELQRIIGHIKADGPSYSDLLRDKTWNTLSDLFKALNVSPPSDPGDLMDNIEKGLHTDYHQGTWIKLLNKNMEKSLPTFAPTQKGIYGVLEVLGGISIGSTPNYDVMLRQCIEVASWLFTQIFTPMSLLKTLISSAEPDTKKTGIGRISSKNVNIMVIGDDPRFPLKLAEAIDKSTPIEGLEGIKLGSIRLLALGTVGQSLASYSFALPLGDVVTQETIGWLNAIDTIVVSGNGLYPGLNASITKNILPVFSVDTSAPFILGKSIGRKTADTAKDITTVLRAAVEHSMRRTKKGEITSSIQYQIPIGGLLQAHKLLSINEAQKTGNIITMLAAKLVRGICIVLGEVTAKDRSKETASILRDLMGDNWLVVLDSRLLHQLGNKGYTLATIKKWAGPKLRKAINEWKKSTGDSSLLPFLSIDAYSDLPVLLMMLMQIGDTEKTGYRSLPLIAIFPQFYTNTSILLQMGLASLGVPVYVVQPPPIIGAKNVMGFMSNDLPNITNGFLRVEINPAKILEDINIWTSQEAKAHRS